MGGAADGAQYLERIHQPEEIEWDNIAPFVTSSRDVGLLELTRKHRCQYMGSTSSMTGILSHIYFAMSNFQPVNVGILGERWRKDLNTFSNASRWAQQVYARSREGGVIAFDSVQEKQPDNKILLDLGKTLERFVTMERDTFESLLVKQMLVEGAQDPWSESAYNYMKAGPFFLRSQLDCTDEHGHIFDIKTRATSPIRNAIWEYQYCAAMRGAGSSRLQAAPRLPRDQDPRQDALCRKGVLRHDAVGAAQVLPPAPHREHGRRVCGVRRGATTAAA